MQEEFQKIDVEMEYFKEDGKVTKKSELLWLQHRGVIRILPNGEVLVIPDKDSKGLSARNYPKMVDLLENYLSKRKTMSDVEKKQETKKVDEILPEDIPF